MPKCKDCDYPYATSSKCPNCGSTNPVGYNILTLFIVFVIILIIAGGIKGANKLHSQNSITDPNTLENNSSFTAPESNNTNHDNNQEVIQSSDTPINNNGLHSIEYFNEAQSAENTTTTTEDNGASTTYQQNSETQIDTFNNPNGNVIYPSNTKETDYYSPDTPIKNANQQLNVKKTYSPDNEKNTNDQTNSLIDALRQAVKKQN